MGKVVCKRLVLHHLGVVLCSEVGKTLGKKKRYFCVLSDWCSTERKNDYVCQHSYWKQCPMERRKALRILRGLGAHYISHMLTYHLIGWKGFIYCIFNFYFIKKGIYVFNYKDSFPRLFLIYIYIYIYIYTW